MRQNHQSHTQHRKALSFMKITSTRLKALIGGAAALAVAASVLPVGSAAALPPGTPAAGTVTLSPASGTGTTAFTVVPPAGAVCPGDNTNGYLFHSFIIPLGQDPADMTFTPSGTPNNKPAFSNNLANSIGTRSRNIAPGLGDGLVIAIANQTFSNAPLFGSLTPGAYTVGIACTQPDAVTTVVNTMRFWSTDITITGTVAGGNLTYATGVAPAAPTLTAADGGNQTCSAVFTPGAGGATSYTATANPGGITATGTASPITIPGLTNGTAYTVSVTATNAVGTSAASNTLPCTPVNGPRTNVTALTATPGAPGSGIINLAWTAPAANSPAATPVSYEIAWTGTASGAASVPFGTDVYSVTGLANGNYTFTVTATYADAPTAGTPAASVSATSSPSSVIIQDIDTVRPVGALVLTQVCSSHAAFPADATASLGFPSGVPAVTALNPSTVGAPTTTGLAPTLTKDGVRPADSDPNFAEYPYPTDDVTFEANATYPTHCGIDLGRARFVTRGAGAGQFFAATGVIDQITVVDTRDDDAGWSVAGTMGQFAANGGTDTFSGSQLGWAPVVTDDTDAFTDSLGNSYDQLATAGPVVNPNTAAATGLSAGSTLMSAAPGSGLGIAIADARLKLLIPVTADAGTYEGVLTFSAS